jgi:CubicO group peptidase (beta-lactamase class C family)
MSPVRTKGYFLAVASICVSACTLSPTESAAAPAPQAASESNDAARIAAIVDPLIGADLSASGTPGAAFVFVRDGRIVYAQGYGVSDVATSSVVDPEKTVWPVASITKVITAMAALQLVDQGHVELDADVNRYLKRLQVPSQGYGPLTLRHLLSHTAALDELPGRQFDGNQRPDMAAFLTDRLVRYRAPGELTAYSTYGMALVGVLVEDATGQSYADYVVQHILKPAGMNHAWIMTAQGDEKGVATPYEVEDRRAEAIPHEWYVTTPTSSMVASVSDMARLLLIHLANGNAGANRLLTPELTHAMQTQQATIHPDLPGWGLGFQLDRVNGKSLAEHGGDIAGFSSLFSLIPEENAGFFIVHHGESGDLRFRVKQSLMDALYPLKVAADVPVPNPKNIERLAEYSGRYISSFACRSCPEAAEQAFSVTVEVDGTLSLWGQKWVPLRRDLFIRDDGKRLLGFARDSGGRVVSVSGGSWRVADRLNNS